MVGIEKRFIQRFDSFSRAFARLEELVMMIAGKETYSLFSDERICFEEEIVREALIKRFEFTQELSWNLLKDYMTYQGEVDLAGSRDVYRRALKLGLISDTRWMNMILDRNLSAHDYNDMKSKEITGRIINEYYPLLKSLRETMEVRISEAVKNK
ncbi:MAG: nucleotidyltransferase substrate binding protein [Muribaculaceae bacterium]|nr:nucleotidyltransferase substrate binding protein [Muribaculaceae bacterium]